MCDEAKSIPLVENFVENNLLAPVERVEVNHTFAAY